MSHGFAVGIDLGATSSALARIDDVGRSAMFRNTQGDLLIPSVVFFEDEELVFGTSARQAAALVPNRAAESVKRDLGQAHYSRAISGRLLATPFVEACLLERLVADLPPQADGKPAIVLALPACFHEAQRAARLQAAEIAGVDLLGTVDEPLAAALAYAEVQGYLKEGSTKPGGRILVCDLGGGKLDMAIIELKPHRVRTLAVGGNAWLGGRDWDARLADWLASEYARHNGQDPRHDMTSVRRLLQTAQETKHTLSARQQARVHVERSGHGLDITATRAQFEEVTRSLNEQIGRIAAETLARAGLAWRDLSTLLLVGGATRMPMVGQLLEALTGLKPALNLHPDEAVARGSAIVAEQILATREGRPAKVNFQIAHITPRSLGVEWQNPSNEHLENVVLIPRGAELPCSTSSIVITEENDQPLVTVRLLEGESRDVAACQRIADVELRGLPPVLPLGSRIEVQYGYAVDGRLAVQARMLQTGMKLDVKIRPENGLEPDQLGMFADLVRSSAGLKAIEARLPAAEMVAAATIVQTEVPEAYETEDNSTAMPVAAPSSAPPLPVVRVPAAPARAVAAPRATEAAPDSSQAIPGPWAETAKPPPLDQVRREPMEELPNFGQKRKRPKTQRGLRFHVINIAGFALFSALGLALGYYIMFVWLKPANVWNYLNPATQERRTANEAPTNDRAKPSPTSPPVGSPPPIEPDPSEAQAP